MVIERAELTIAEGKEAEFVAAMVRGVKLLSTARGGQDVTFGRSVENPSKFILLINWESVESHIDFTKTAEFASFRELAGPFFAGKPAMEHFQPL